MQIKAAIGSFFVEFSKFEMNFVGLALHALSKDSVFVEQAEKLLGLEARLTLLERMASARGIAAPLITELEELMFRTRKLREQRDEVARALALLESDRTVQASDPVANTFKSQRKRGSDFIRLSAIRKLSMPSLSQIEAHSVEAIELQNGLRALAEKLDAHLSNQQQLPA